VNVRFRTTALIIGAAALFSLAACSAGTTTDPGADTEETQAPVVETAETACPDGFVDAFATASADAYEPGLVVTETTVDAFEPAFLAPFLDGGCAVHVTGTLLGGGAAPVDGDYGFAPDAATAEAIGAALEAEGYEEDPNFPGGYQSDTGFAGVFLVGGEVTTPGSAALEQFYPNGVLFYA